MALADLHSPHKLVGYNPHKKYWTFQVQVPVQEQHFIIYPKKEIVSFYFFGSSSSGRLIKQYFFSIQICLFGCFRLKITLLLYIFHPEC
jgi:hypothetical protein